MKSKAVGFRSGFAGIPAGARLKDCDPPSNTSRAHIPMMETTDFRKRDDFADRMDRARIRRVFLQGQMKTGFVVVTEISNHISEVSGTYFPKPLMTKSVASRVSEYL